jgi:hypothetical protein
MRYAIVSTLCLIATTVFSQNIIIKGTVKDASTNAPIAMAEVKILKTSISGKSDSAGNFALELAEPGFYVIGATREGYFDAFAAEMLFTYDKSPFVQISMESLSRSIGTVNISRSALQTRRAESPVGAQSLSIREIERNPGGNRDISKIVQSLPGVISVPSFRNDIVIRGGSPVENKFYLDGFEIPVINHFQTQGSTGGPVGILNVNFIKEVNFYTGAFPINYANGMSAVVDFRQIDGNTDKPKFRFTLGSSDLGFTADGPLGKSKKTTFIVSARQSYLQGLFTLLKLPFLPNFIDYQAKVKTKLSNKSELNVVMLGAVDYFRINTNVNDGITDSIKLKTNQYLLGYIPDYQQWNYMIGASYTYFGKAKHQVFLSRNMLSNISTKFQDNDESDPSKKILDYRSTEEENKLRYEQSRRFGRWSVMNGGGFEFAQYGNSTFNRISTPVGPQTINFRGDLNLLKYNVFSKWNRSFASGAMVAMGFRLDGSGYNENTRNPLNQPGISLSASLPVADGLFFNANVGRFHQLPAYTLMGYRDSSGRLANQNTLQYLRNSMAAAGFQYNYGPETKITLEGFYKQYQRYPVALREGISLGNLGGDFAIVGNEPVISNGTGRAYGMEFLVQRRSRKGLYGIASYTLCWSSFADPSGKLVASAWDSRHTVVLTGGMKLKRNWELGVKWRFITGRPFTPYDTNRSLSRSSWDVVGQALPDYRRLNTLRVGDFNQFDVRVDKVWYFRKSSLNLYLDIQNFFNTQYVGPNTLVAARNADGSLITDPANPLQYRADFLPNTSGTVLPTIGVILDF